MKKFNFARTVVLIPVMVALTVSNVSGQEEETELKKRAQTGMKFLSFSVDARAAALANAVTADDRGSAVSIFYNPASMGWLDGTLHAAFGQTQWIADITYNAAGVAFRPAAGMYGVFGLSVLTVDYGKIQETIRFDNEAGYLDLGTFAPSALAVGFGYARTLTARFSVGGNVKYVKEDLGRSVMRLDDEGNPEREDNIQSTVAFDFGVFYRTGFRSLVLAMSARNFSQDITYAEESFELPLSFRMGLGMNLIDFTAMDRDRHSLQLSVDTERSRDFNEVIRVGGEYLFINTVALRGGYAFPTDEQGINLGVGIQRSFGTLGVRIDYAYMQFGVFDNVNRVAFEVSF